MIVSGYCLCESDDEDDCNDMNCPAGFYGTTCSKGQFGQWYFYLGFITVHRRSTQTPVLNVVYVEVISVVVLFYDILILWDRFVGEFPVKSHVNYYHCAQHISCNIYKQTLPLPLTIFNLCLVFDTDWPIGHVWIQSKYLLIDIHILAKWYTNISCSTSVKK